MIGRMAVPCLSIYLAGALLGCSDPGTQASTAVDGFRQTNLVSDIPGAAAHVDPRLADPRGIGVGAGQPFWIVEHDRGTARVFDPSGTPVSPQAVALPPARGSTAPAAPTGVVFNPITEDFQVRGTPARFLFATENGTISTWDTVPGGHLPTSAVLALDRSQDSAVYKGLAIVSPECCREFLVVANFRSASIETYTVGFSPLAPPGSFTDPALPAGYAPFNVQLIGDQVFISYAVRDAAGRDPVFGSGNGIVSIFDEEGNFLRRFVSNGPLDAPWGMARAGANFGPFSHAILVGNFGDGIINAFDPETGAFLGPLKDRTGSIITNPGLWALTFGSDGAGDPDRLYFTAGAPDGHGLFGALSFQSGD